MQRSSNTISVCGKARFRSSNLSAPEQPRQAGFARPRSAEQSRDQGYGVSSLRRTPDRRRRRPEALIAHDEVEDRAVSRAGRIIANTHRHHVAPAHPPGAPCNGVGKAALGAKQNSCRIAVAIALAVECDINMPIIAPRLRWTRILEAREIGNPAISIVRASRNRSEEHT